MAVGGRRGAVREGDDVIDAAGQSGGARAGGRSITAAGILLGVGVGGFVDGIVLHQILQWHHMLTDHGRYAAYPRTTVADLEDNTLADGLFHAGTWVATVVGLILLWRALAHGRTVRTVTWRTLAGLVLVGWGLFNLVEGIVDHHVLSIHHVRDDVADPFWWDLGFLVLGAALVLTGLALWRSDRVARGFR
jgi:uncharacterized membrane protein